MNCKTYICPTIFSLMLSAFPFLGLTQHISSPEIILGSGFGYDLPKAFDADGDGDLDILTFPYLYLNNGKGQREKMITLSDPEIKFETFVIEDLNQDKKKDIVALKKNGEICVFMNTADGFIKIKQALNVDYKPAEYAEILVLDINSDGVSDLVIKSLQGPTIGYAGNKKQQFVSFKPFNDFAYDKRELIGADLTGDGIQELLATQNLSRSRNSGECSLIAFNYKGAKYSVSDTILTTQASVRDLRFLDMDKDGYHDLVFRSISKGRSIHWMKRKRNGSLGKESVFLKDFDGKEYQFGDYDSDGDLDLVYSSSSNRTDAIKWVKNNGDATFEMDCKSLISAAVQSEQFIFDDFDGDKIMDVFYCQADGKTRPRYNMVLMDKIGASKSKNTWVVNGECYGFHLADLNGDGYKDVIGYFLHEMFYSLIDREGKSSEVNQLKVNPFKIGYVSSADIDNDGKTDLLIHSNDSEGGVLGWCKNEGNMRFSELKPIHSGTGRLIASECIDFDKDGLKDIIVNYWEDKVYGFYSYRNEGNGTFAKTKKTVHASSTNKYPKLAVFDVDLDGTADVLDINSGAWYDFDAAFQWKQHTSELKVPMPHFMLKINIDGDSLQDGLLVNAYSINAFEQDSSGQWKPAPIQKMGFKLDNLQAGDMTGDGVDDLVCIAEASEFQAGLWGEPLIGSSFTMVLMKNNGAGTYTKVPLYPSNGLSGLELHDIDNDGDLDIVGSDRFWHTYGIRVWKNLLKD